MIIKRFTLIKNTGTDEYYSDNLYDNGTYIGVIHGGSEMICYLLNNLHEENQDLKSFNEDLAENLSTCANARISKDNWIEKLIEENEQLKIALEDKENLISICEKKFKELGYLITCDDDGYVIE